MGIMSSSLLVVANDRLGIGLGGMGKVHPTPQAEGEARACYFSYQISRTC